MAADTVKQHIPFNVIIEDNGIFKPYDIMPYLMRCVKEKKPKKDLPTAKEGFMEFVKNESMYMWWARCQYEIILVDWPGQTKSEKWDVHQQVMMNLELITETLLRNINRIDLIR